MGTEKQAMDNICSWGLSLLVVTYSIALLSLVKPWQWVDFLIYSVGKVGNNRTTTPFPLYAHITVPSTSPHSHI